MKKVCLYIYKHNITGLKYFGKTTRFFKESELLSYYKGSGSYWNHHLKKHGKDISVEIYGIYNLNEVESIALKFSEDNNIVNAINESGDRKGKKVWANEKPENGLDGGSIKGNTWSDESKKKLSLSIKGHHVSKETKEKLRQANIGKKHSEESKKLMVTNRKYRNHSEETKKLISERTKGKNKGAVRSEEHKKKISLAQKGMPKPQKVFTCPHCNKKGGNAMKRWHFDNCKLRG